MSFLPHGNVRHHREHPFSLVVVSTSAMSMQINPDQISQDRDLSLALDASHRCDERAQAHPLPGEASSAEELSTGIHGADEELGAGSGEQSFELSGFFKNIIFMLATTSGVNGGCPSQCFLSPQTEGPVNPTSPRSEHQVIGEVREESSGECGAQEDAVQPIDCAPAAMIIDLTGLSQDHQLEVGDGK
jgi:hypothetical protein